MPAHRASRTSIRGVATKVVGLPRAIAALPRNQRLAIGGTLLGVIGLVVGIIAAGVFATSPTREVAHHPTTTTAPAVVSARCPLTDLPAPQGVPNRPALAIKIGNEPDGARPQSGLNEADIVYDTPAEGFIMRYVAVFQCDNAAMIGPVRSVRWVDWHIVQQFGHPILTFAGGINPDVDAVMGLGWLDPANLLEGAQSAGTRISSREPPDNLYTSTNGLYGLFKTNTTPPKPVFQFTVALPSGARAATGLGINFSAGTDARWQWDQAAHAWIHGYTTGADIDTLTNKPVSTTNIVVQSVSYSFGPYIESPGGSGDVESNTIGSGSGYVLRNGLAIKVTWHRAGLGDPMTFTDAAGQSVGLAPGRTWVEIVPDSTFDSAGGVTVTYGATTPGLKAAPKAHKKH